MLAGLVLIFFVSSCKKGDFLDKKIEPLNAEGTFLDSANTTAFLSRIYADINYCFNDNRVPWSAATDESIQYAFTGTQNDGVLISVGALSPATTNANIINTWTTAWQNIRRVNVFLAKVDGSPLSDARKIQFKGEARFLRAWYYSILLKIYGGVPLIADKVYDSEDSFTDLERSSYNDCVNYVVAELDAAAALLPSLPNQVGQDYGRITKGACLGVKTKVLLFAASPLFNGEGFATDAALKNIAGYPDVQVSRWQKVIDVSDQIINSGIYDIVVDNTTRPGYGYYIVFQRRVNTEYLFPYMTAPNRTYEGFMLPPSRTNSNTSQTTVPVQHAVDAYQMKNGLSITDPLSGYDPAFPYRNREPRFYNTIIHNEAPFFLASSGNNQPVLTFFNSGTPDQFNNGKINNTSYYWRKMCFESGNGNTDRCLPLIRYAEILLANAEATNEVEAAPGAKVYDVLKKIRNRAGIDAGTNGLYGLKANMTKAEMRAAIQHEWRIEFMNEEHRMWDARRWKIADGPFSLKGNGTKITKTGTVYTYENVNIVTKSFPPRSYYLFPIPQGEVSKSPKMLQNPGW